MIETYLRLAKVYIRLDQPKRALDTYLKGYEYFPGDISLILGRARIFEELNDVENSAKAYREVFIVFHRGRDSLKMREVSRWLRENSFSTTLFDMKVLKIDASNAEAIASLASHRFYGDQPEISLLLYRRLLQVKIGIK